MKVSEIAYEIMFQTANDEYDLGDFQPYLMDYINDGYDMLVYAWAKEHVPSENYPRLTADEDIPNVPEWTHRALADWATWLVYRNGNPQRQSRGYPFRTAFLELLNKVTSEGGNNGPVRNFFNIPR